MEYQRMMLGAGEERDPLLTPGEVAGLFRVDPKTVTLMNWKAASAATVDPALCSAIKVYGTEFFIDAYRLLGEVLGPRGSEGRESPLALLGEAGKEVARV